MTHLLWSFGRYCSWNFKAIKMIRKSYNRKISLLFSLKKLVRRVQACGIVLWTFVISFWQNILIKATFPLIISPLWKWFVTSCQNPYKENCSKSFVSWLWETNTFHPNTLWQYECIGRPEYWWRIRKVFSLTYMNTHLTW